MKDSHLATAVRARARELGFDPVGIARVGASDHAAFYRHWLRDGRHGAMDYLARPDAVERRADVRRTLESARSAIVVGHNYAQDDRAGVPGDPSRGVVARYARNRDYHRVLARDLKALHRRLEEEAGGPVEARAYTDTAPILERDLARRAGVGWFGKNTMLIHPRKGSYFLLGALLTEMELEPDPPFEADHCGTCRRCIEACPTGALLGRDLRGAPVMEARRCISYLTIELRGPIPRELRPLVGNRVFGCDICQEVCPFNEKFAEPTSNPAYAARGPGERPHGVQRDPTVPEALHPGTNGPLLTELLETALSEESWESFSRGSPIRRPGRAGFARNVCVAMGNWLADEKRPDLTAVDLLVRALSDAEPLVRGHAAWALGRARTAEARPSLEGAMASEDDSWVRDEIALALGA